MSALGCIIVSIICFCNGHWAYGLGALAIICVGIVAGCIGDDTATVDSAKGEGVIEKDGILYKKCCRDSVCVVGVKERQDLLELRIPSSLGDWPVWEIKENAFKGCENVRSVTIPQGVKVIAQGTFSNCVSLRSVTIPESVVRIDRDAFENCTCLRSVIIPDGVVSVDYRAFAGCANLYDVKIAGVPPEHVFWAFLCLPIGASVVGMAKHKYRFNTHDDWGYGEEDYEGECLEDRWADRGEKDGWHVWCRV